MLAVTLLTRFWWPCCLDLAFASGCSYLRFLDGLYMNEPIQYGGKDVSVAGLTAYFLFRTNMPVLYCLY